MNDFADNHLLTRRRALQWAAVGGAALYGLPGCGGDDSSSSGGSAPDTSASIDSFKGATLNVFTWAGYHDKKWIAEYEKKRGVKVNLQLFGSVQDGFAKVRADPGAFDLVLATSGWIENYADAGLIVPIDETKIPNLKNATEDLTWRDVTRYKGKDYGVLYTWGNEPLAWLENKVSPAPDSWRALYDERYRGKVSLVDDPTTIMPFLPVMLGFKDPFNLNEQQFGQMKKALMDLRGQVDHVSASIEDQTTDFASGEVEIGVLYNIGTQAALDADGIALKQIVPKEGAAAWSDNYVITKAGAKKATLAYDFMDYTLAVPWQARFAGETGNASALSLDVAKSPEAVEAGLDAEALKKTPLSVVAGPEYFERVKLIKRVPNLDEWLAAWNEFKSGI
jgi:spermidine/putrescine-binding protein